MNIVVSFQDQPACERLAWAARRALAEALARFANRIRGITVRFRGADDAASGAEPQCALAIDVARGGEIRLQATGGSPETALRELAGRAARSVRSAVARTRPVRRAPR